MATVIARLTLNQKLAAVTFALGAIALFATPYQGATVSVDTAALAAAVAAGDDQVAPRDLAAWLLGGRADYRLIDIRSEADFAADRIPNAENIPVSGLLDAGLLRNETIVLYGDDGVQSAQAWLLLRAKGYRGASLLKGGLAGWRSDVVFPTLVENPTPEQQAENAKVTAIAAYFGGQARVTSGALPAVGAAPGLSQTPAGSSPVVAPPSAPKGATRPAAKKKKEGC